MYQIGASSNNFSRGFYQSSVLRSMSSRIMDRMNGRFVKQYSFPNITAWLIIHSEMDRVTKDVIVRYGKQFVDSMEQIADYAHDMMNMLNSLKLISGYEAYTEPEYNIQDLGNGYLISGCKLILTYRHGWNDRGSYTYIHSSENWEEQLEDQLRRNISNILTEVFNKYNKTNREAEGDNTLDAGTSKEAVRALPCN